MATFGIVLVTVDSQVEGEAIARALVETRLAACVNLFPIQSIYTWQGEVCQDPEWQLTIKTDLACFEGLAAKIRELHSYDVPEILALPIVNGSPTYLEWIGASVAAEGF